MNLGLLYDENVLNIAAQNSATSLKAYRLNYGGHVFFHVVNTAKSQWSPTFNFSDMYSLSTELKSDPTIQSTDPMLLDFSFPYRSDFSIGKASSTLTVSPALQLIYMTKNTSARELVFQNYTLTTALTIGHTAALTSTYKIYLTKENSNYTVSFPDDNQNTQKTMVTVSNYYLLDKDYNENAIFELSYLLNKADGVNISYRKPTATLGYVRTFATKWTLYAKADYSSADYYESSFSRKDSTSAFSINTSYSLNAADNVNLGLQYQKNNSNNDVYNYSKFIFSLGYSISHF